MLNSRGYRQKPPNPFLYYLKKARKACLAPLSQLPAGFLGYPADPPLTRRPTLHGVCSTTGVPQSSRKDRVPTFEVSQRLWPLSVCDPSSASPIVSLSNDPLALSVPLIRLRRQCRDERKLAVLPAGVLILDCLIDPNHRQTEDNTFLLAAQEKLC